MTYNGRGRELSRDLEQAYSHLWWALDELVPDTLDTLAECINCEDRAILRQVPRRPCANAVAKA